MEFKTFQHQDYARLGIVDSAICAHDTGLSKTWGGYTYALLRADLPGTARVTPGRWIRC